MLQLVGSAGRGPPYTTVGESVPGMSERSTPGYLYSQAPARSNTANSMLGGMRISNSMFDSIPFLYRIDAKPTWALMCLVPKAGSTMWKRAITRGLIAQGLAMVDAPGKWHNSRLPYNVSAAASKDVRLRLMLVRHPIPRLLSAYLGKMVGEQTNLLTSWQRTYLPEWNRSMGFAGFVRALTAKDATKVADDHFRLQAYLCRRGQPGQVPLWSYRYLRVEELGHWYREIICKLRMAGAVSAENPYWSTNYNDTDNLSTTCFVRTHDCGCEIDCGGHRCNASHVSTQPDASFGSFNQATERLEDFYNDDLAQRVNTWAAPDLRAFGYRPWRPGQPVASTVLERGDVD